MSWARHVATRGAAEVHAAIFIYHIGLGRDGAEHFLSSPSHDEEFRDVIKHRFKGRVLSTVAFPYSVYEKVYKSTGCFTHKEPADYGKE